MARKARRKSLEWGFARKSGGQYGVSKLRGWRKEFYCEFRWDERPRITLRRMFSHRWHGWTQMLGCAGIEQRIADVVIRSGGLRPPHHQVGIR